MSAVADAAELDRESRLAAVTDQMRRLLPGNERLLFLMELSIEPVLAGLDR